MSDQTSDSVNRVPGTAVPDRDEIGRGPFVGETRTAFSRPGIQTGDHAPEIKNRVQWGPIVAGLLTTIATMLVLTVLGLAIGASVLDPNDSGDGIGTAAGIWGGISAILSFLLGGWVAAKSAAVGGPGSGLLNGFMVGAAALALILWLTGSGLGSLFGVIGNNIGDIANVAQDEGVSTTDIEQETTDADQAVDDATDAFADAEEGAWGTLGGLLLALGSATVGGLLGHNKRQDLIEGTG